MAQMESSRIEKQYLDRIRVPPKRTNESTDNADNLAENSLIISLANRS